MLAPFYSIRMYDYPAETPQLESIPLAGSQYPIGQSLLTDEVVAQKKQEAF